VVGTKKRRRAAALQNAPRVYSECGVEDRPSPHKAVVLPNSAIFPDKPNPAHSLFVFSFADLTGDGVADFFETGEVPKIGEFPAFPGLHGLHAAFALRQKDAGAVRLILQSQTLAIVPQTRELLDEIEFGQTQMGRQPGDLRVRQSHLPGPATAGSASLTFQESRHHEIL